MRLVETHGTHMELTEAIKVHLEKRLKKLAFLLDGVEPADIRADLGKTSEHHHKGEIFRAELNLQLPGNLLRVEKVTDDLYKSIDEAAKVLGEQVKKWKDK